MPSKKKQIQRVGAYPVKHHMVCPERTRLDISGDPAAMLDHTDGTKLRMTSGVVFESEMIEKMLKGFKRQNWTVLRFQVGENADSLRRFDEVSDVEHCVVNIECQGERTQEAKDRMFEATKKAMSRGVRVIFGARLMDDELVGEPDGLVREQPEGSKRSRWTYLGLDFKDHKSFQGTQKSSSWMWSKLSAPFFDKANEDVYEGVPQLVDSMQLVMYHKLLESNGRAGARWGGIIGREGRVIWRNLDEELYWRNSRSAYQIWNETYTSYRQMQDHERARMNGKQLEPLSRPELKSDCGECPWRQVCHEELEARGDITLVPDMTPSRAAIHRELGVDTFQQLSELDWLTAKAVETGADVAEAIDVAQALKAPVQVDAVISAKYVDAFRALGLETSSDVAGLCRETARWSKRKPYRFAESIDQARVVRYQRVHRARGVDHVEIPRAAIELDIDIEDDSGGICYLIGVRETIRQRGEKRSRYIPFVTWDDTEDAEAQVFAQFWAYIQETRHKAAAQKLGSVRCFYYTEHETRYFRHLAKAHAGKPGIPTSEELEEFLTSELWFDMHPVIGRQLVWPTSDRTLKSLAKYVKFFWRDETPGGANSVAWYREAVATDGSERSEELKQRILDYNEDDVEATFVLREWVSRFGESRKPGTKLPSVAELDRRYRKTRKSPAA